MKSAGSSVLGALLGGLMGGRRTSVSTAARVVGNASQQSNDVRQAERTLQLLDTDRKQLHKELDLELEELRVKYDINKIELEPFTIGDTSYPGNAVDQMTEINKDISGVRHVLATCKRVLCHSSVWPASDIRPIRLRCDESIKTRLFAARPDSEIILYQNSILSVRGPYTLEQSKALAKRYIDRKVAEVEDVAVRADILAKNIPIYDRRAIPTAVRNTVWKRDNGRCVQCGSIHDLEFDHMIPVSKGGNNASKNIQVLCRPCNRSKSDKI